MPSEAKPYPKNSLLDGRRKITKDLYPQIVRDYLQLKSYQKTADKWGVSKRTIIFIVRPETLKALQTNQKLIQHWKQYYNTEKRRFYMRTYRTKKRALGLIIKK